MATKEGARAMIEVRFFSMLELKLLTLALEDEFLRLRIVFGSVLALTGDNGGIKERTSCLGTMMSFLMFSSPGWRQGMIISLGLAGAFPST
jgi:hypothetical protein